jgi:hypothetical protein
MSLESIAKTTHEIWYDEEYADDQFKGIKWVPLKEALEAVKTERLKCKQEVAKILLKNKPELVTKLYPLDSPVVNNKSDDEEKKCQQE